VTKGLLRKTVDSGLLERAAGDEGSVGEDKTKSSVPEVIGSRDRIKDFKSRSLLVVCYLYEARISSILDPFQYFRFLNLT
jgi:hypothetical protein